MAKPETIARVHTHTHTHTSNFMEIRRDNKAFCLVYSMTDYFW